MHVNDWIVSGFGFEPRPLGVRPVVERGPVVMRRVVRVLEMNDPRMGEGDVRVLRRMAARVSGVVKRVRIVKRVVVRLVLGFGEGMMWIVRRERERASVMTLLIRVRMVGVVFVSVGQREREKAWGRLVV